MSALTRFAPQLSTAATAALLARSPAAASSSTLLALRDSLVGAVQNYSTVHGNGVTVRFRDDGGHPLSSAASLSSFVECPLAVGSYETAVLEEWFGKLSEPRFRMHRDRYGVPLDDVERKIGMINTAYHTAYVSNCVSATGAAAASSSSSSSSSRSVVPFAGSAEFTLLPHRQELNLSVTLWDAQRRPLTTTTWTGPKAPVNGGPMGTQMSSAEVEREEASMKRVPVEASDDKSAPRLEWADDSAMQATPFLPADSLPFALDGASLCVTRNGGFSVMARPLSSQSVAESQASPPVILPAALHDMCVAALARNVWAHAVVKHAGFKASDGTDGHATSLSCVAIVAKVATLGAVLADQPFELRTAPPLFSERLRSKPWEHRVGMPLLRGQPCLALRVETIQNGILAGSGTYYFGRIAAK